MKYLHSFLMILAMVISGTMTAQSQRELSQLMRSRGEYYFTLSVNGPSEIQTLARLCSVDKTDGKTVVCYANQREYDQLLQAGFQPNLQTPPSMLEEAKMWDGNRATYEWDSYPTYSQLESMMQAYPSTVVSGRTCTYMELGTLTSGRKIMGVRINNGSPAGKPKFLYSSTIHGDETTGMILLLRLIDELCTSTDSRIVRLVDSLDIFIFPDANPDGTYYGGNNTVTGSRRANANGIDMNRNYADPHSSAHPDGNAYQSETQWFMQLAEDHPFTMAANFHGGAEVVNYPWDNTYTRHADDAWWQYISAEYVANTRTVYASYMTDTYSSGITNGADWYMIGGGRQDYMNGYCQCREITIECSTTKTLEASKLNSYWNYNHNAMLAFMEQCINGVHGFVYDADTHLPLDGVTITVQDHDDEYSIISTHTNGDFHRPIKGGTYTFSFEKDGYCPIYREVTIADGQRVNLNDIELTPGNCIVPYFTASSTNIAPGQSVSFTDASTGSIASWYWTFEGGTPSTSTAQNPSNITYNTVGTYDVTLTITDSEGNSQILTKEDYINVAASYNMSNTTVTTCDALFYDSGGANSDYSNNQTYTMTFYPETEGAYISVTFSEFNTESGYDYLYIYDGTSTSATQIGQYHGSNSPGTVTATNDSGALTFKFTSDSGVTASGWVAAVSCVIPERTITATANPADGGTVEGAGTYNQGDTCTLTASAADNYRFVHWTENGEVVSTDSIFSFRVTGDRTLVAVFGSTEPISITVAASPSRGGSASGGGEYLYGENCTVTATPNTGYTFTGWTENGTVVSENQEYTFMVASSKELVANFVFASAEPKDCYYTVANTSITAGDYVMGYLNGTTLTMPTHNNSNTITTTQATVTLTDYGFSVTEGTTVPKITLTAYQTNGQYYISYNGRYLNRSSYGGSLSWGTNQSQATRWTINANGISMTSNNRTYYLYYNNGSFSTNTTQQNNITFYTEDDCPVTQFTITATAEPSEGGTVEGADIYFLGETCTLTATANQGYQFVNWTENGEVVTDETSISFEVSADRELVAIFEAAGVTQTITLSQGWNWWSTYLDITLDQLESAMGVKGVSINNAVLGSVLYNQNYQAWDGDFQTLDHSRMYQIEMSSDQEIVLSGTILDPANQVITINPGINWIGFPVSQSMSLQEAFANFTPNQGDALKSKTGTSLYNNGRWSGSMQLEPGKGYIYISKASETKTFYFPSNNQ